MINAIVIYLAIVLVMSLACFAVYWRDKRRATNGGRRDGFPGRVARSVVVFWLVVVPHVAIVTSANVFLGPRKLT